ncbi:bifunctional folylpolyglutamate synthase/dihydrofolate synthase [Altererythrobacter sp. SALINAS58]|uniref:bifunctional folylpolyglutamate synthase/dihydrofolate synthase n=1 Tax=Alteripontixanthobacter muriae TaxID=2705546 RepID=UPI001575681C|nr:bifunctional folylpolyglutamate synthase/dihydrofolate synthase [Alteripontixanthobacter muriae]NTZ42995.1 bifunctional folylpolyglutamate synthase/dihydrofolate synthase [Alteripontixanthobacter muriae]
MPGAGGDFARSDNPAVQEQLDRLAALSVPQGRLGTDTIRTLLGRLGNPQDRLPPVFHVAGTNGKGSTCAFLRAMMEAEGLRVHAAISPHLVRYNERIRLAGTLIDDAALASVLAEVLDAGADLAPSFFEATVAATLLEFARTPADACVVEVGLGGRFDATNVFESPAACGIATLGIDHEQFLLLPEAGTPEVPLARIAFEKAGIVRPGSSLVTLSYPPEAELEVERAAMAAGAPLAMRGRHWTSSADDLFLEYQDRHGRLTLPVPSLPGAHQADNAALAAAMLRHQDFITVSPEAMAAGIRKAKWPGRLQAIRTGPLAVAATGHELWLDGGHNRNAGEAVARHFAEQHLHLVIGMLANKDPGALIDALDDRLVSITAVPVPGHDYHQSENYGSRVRMADDVFVALQAIPPDGLPVLIGGSLYLAGDVLRLSGEIPY